MKYLMMKDLMKRSGISGAVILVAAGTAYAGSTQSSVTTAATVTRTTVDLNGMPHCLSLSNGDALVLKWKKESYQRDIYAARISTLSGRASVDQTNTSRNAAKNCANYATFESRMNDKDAKWASDSSVLENVILSEKLVNSLKQLSMGGNTFHAESTGAEYLAAHPIKMFTRELDRELAGQFGMGFTGEIYRAHLAERPEYQIFESGVNQYLNSPSKSTLGEKAPGVTVMLANGFMQAPANNVLKPMEDLLRAQGLNVVVFKMDSIGAIKTNVGMLKEQIIAAAASGNKLILMGGSKGVPELLSAVAELKISNPALIPQMRAVVNLSGMIEGSFLLDWGTKLPQRIFVEKMLKKQAAAMGINMNTMDGLKDMTTKNLVGIVPNVLPQLPLSVTYFNVIGIPGGNGLVREEHIVQLQNSVSRIRISNQGANDGYIEFPGTEIPNTLNLKLYTVAFNSSHILLDGWYEGHDLRDPVQRTNVITALFNSILDLSN